MTSIRVPAAHFVLHVEARAAAVDAQVGLSHLT